MPSHKSCKKRLKTSNLQRIRNRASKSELRGNIKELRQETDKEQAAQKYKNVMSLLDRAASNGLIHKKNADRHKARLAKFVQKLG